MPLMSVDQPMHADGTNERRSLDSGAAEFRCVGCGSGIGVPEKILVDSEITPSMDKNGIYFYIIV